MDAYIDFELINKIFYTLFLFILALFSAWSWDLLPQDLVHLFDTDRRAQLVTLLLLFVFTLQYFSPEHDIIQVFFHAVAMFFIYLLITKQSLHNFILTMVGFIFSALFTNNIKYFHEKMKTAKSEKDKKTIKNKIEDNTKHRNISIIFTLVTTFVGVSLYFVKQYKDHYKNENILLFVLKFLLEGGSKQRKTTGNVISR